MLQQFDWRRWIEVQRYRFQDVEFTDPIVRGLSSIKSIEPKLSAAATHMANSLSISNKDALSILSPNIQFVSDISSSEQHKSEEKIEEEEE